MAKRKYTPEEIKQYYAEIRERWTIAKELSTSDKCRAILDQMALHGITEVSPTSIMAVQMQLEELGLDGLPFVDVKTFQGWKEIGYVVRKGQKSILTGVSWKPTEKKNQETGETEETGRGRLLAKGYALFHRSQVEKMEDRTEAEQGQRETDQEDAFRAMHQD